MKLPALRLDKDAFLGFLLRHGEKIVGGGVAVVAALLLWGGIDSLRSRSVRTTELPATIRDEVDRAEQHIASLPQPPDDLLPAHRPLTDDLGPWLAAKSQAPPALAVLDKPLFPEFSRRPQPEVLPLEDLRAVAGVAVLPVPAADALQERFPTRPERRRPDRDREPQPTDPAGLAQPGGLGETWDGGLGGPVAVGRVVPYVIVTGLVPVAKQQEEYSRRFADAGYRDARRDVPLWSDFTIERCSVVNGADGPWRPIDLAAAADIQTREWGGTQPLPVPSEYLLQPTDERRSRDTPLDFAGQLPQRIDQPWAAEPLHPWVLAHIRDRIGRGLAAGGDQPDAGTQPQVEPPVFGEAGGFDGGWREPGMPGPSRPGVPGMADGPGLGMVPEAPPEYRVFSFVDTTAKPENRYRYRVRLKVWNPNINLPPQHLADPAFATEQRLTSAASAATAAVFVPDPARLLLEVLPAADLKKIRMKPGMLEVLVLAPAADTGNYSLRSVLTDLGGFANVDKRLNRPGDQRGRGEDVVTNRLLVDVAGQQVEAEEKARRGPRRIPEPFAAIFMRPDGTVEQVTAADSERLADRYRPTLPDRDAGRRGGRPAAANPEPDVPSGQQSDSPFPPPR